MSKTVSGAATAFVWDVAGELPLLLVDGTTNYVYGPDGLPLEQITSSGTVTYYHHDQLGSTRALTNSAGTVVATYTYDPYGRLTASTGSATNPFGYGGQYTDAETGFQYLRARYYDPGTGQFLSVDPALMQTFSRYGYVDGNPLNGTDPMGLFWGQGTLKKVGRAVTSAASWAVEHPTAALGLAAGATCIVTTGGACTALVYTAAAANVTVSAMQNVVQPLARGDSANWSGFGKDVAVTALATGTGIAVTGPMPGIGKQFLAHKIGSLFGAMDPSAGYAPGYVVARSLQILSNMGSTLAGFIVHQDKTSRLAALGPC